MTPLDPDWQNITFDPETGFRVETAEAARKQVDRYETVRYKEIYQLKQRLQRTEKYIANLRSKIKESEDHLIWYRRNRLGTDG